MMLAVLLLVTYLKVVTLTLSPVMEVCAPATCDKVKLGEFAMKMSQSSPTCYCDKSCSIHGDCCYDAPETSHPSAKLTALYKSHLVCSSGRDRPISRGMWMVKTCPPKFRNEFVTKFCESETFDKTDRILRWPVTSNVTGVTYRNMYCGTCWGDSSLVYWYMKAKCTQKITMVNGTVVVSKVDGSTGIDVMHDDRFYCDETYSNPVDDGGVTRRCGFGTKTQTCDQSVNVDAEIRRKCKMEPPDIVRDAADNGVYKNRYCALCNGVNDTDLVCPKVFSGHGYSVQGLYPLTILFDLNVGHATLEKHGAFSGVSQLSCQNDEIFDTLTSKCRAIRCGPGYGFRDGRCMLDNTTSSSHAAMSGGAGYRRKEMCAIVSFTRDEYVKLGGDTILLISNGKNYTSDLYRLGTNDSIEVCIDNTDHMTSSAADIIAPDGVPAIVTTVGLSLSLVFLVGLLVIYSLLEKLRTVPGICVMCLSTALLTGQVLLLIGPAASGLYSACVFIAVLDHYAFMAVFAWMNVLAFDLASTFWSERFIAKSSPSSKRRRLLKLSSFGWGFPVLIILVGVILDTMSELTSPFNPSYGTVTCWLNNGKALAVLFIFPVSLMLFINVVLYALTIRGIYTASKAAKTVRRNSDKNNLLLYIKLSLVLGGTWIFAFIWMGFKHPVIQYTYILLNSLQGVFVFIAFCCTVKVFRMLRSYFETGGRPKDSDISVSTRLTSQRTDRDR